MMATDGGTTQKASLSLGFSQMRAGIMLSQHFKETCATEEFANYLS